MAANSSSRVDNDVDSDRLDDVAAEVERRLPPEVEPTTAAAFVRVLYRRMAPAELSRRERRSLVEAACSLIDLAGKRQPGEPLVRVLEERAHVVVEVVTDDMPFLVDTIVMELHAQRADIDHLLHPVLTVRRDGDGRLVELADGTVALPGAELEAVMRIELAARTAPAPRDVIEGITRALGQVRRVVDDWQPMRSAVLEAADDVERRGTNDSAEAAALLRWLAADHLTFVAVRDVRPGADGRPVVSAGSELGLVELFEEPSLGEGGDQDLRLGTAVVHSPVHRADRLDFVGIRRFDGNGRCVGERQLLGLPTSSAEAMSPRDIPVLRRKVADVLAHAAFPPHSHDAKQLLGILEAHPRDEMLRLTTAELYDTAMRVMGWLDRPQVGVVLRHAPTRRYVSCLVYVPADRYSPVVADRVEAVLRETLGGTDTETAVVLGDSPLARLHVIVSVDPHAHRAVDLEALRLVLTAAARSWHDDLHEALIELHGPDDGETAWQRWSAAFPPGYDGTFDPATAAQHTVVLDALPTDDGLELRLRRAEDGQTRLTVFRTGTPLRLSDVLPVLENCGTRVVDERPYALNPAGDDTRWVYDFGLAYELGNGELDGVGRRFAEAFTAVWRGEAENDPLNRLVLVAGLPWREVAILRALTRYLRQAGTPFSQEYVLDTLTHHPKFAGRLLRLFHARLRPEATEAEADVAAEIGAALDRITSLDEDRILRSLFLVVQAILRTNHYQRDADGRPKPYLSVKLDPAKVPGLPLPRPMFEIWVYSPRMEGVHLRGGHVARGGLRWSDRREDFRTEILGLLKAQSVKNAVIVPVGAKGGFVVKQPPVEREALMAEVVACYRLLIQGMLDITDNLVPDAHGRRTVVRPPDDVVRHDGDDPYLVVAADKGTATFSDVANGIAQEYGYWLGDAFASGGSAGYDHKAMGITARGAWVSVQHHFAALGRDPQTEPITVVGIGDMSGDVFGNGMLLSRQIRLVAAFDHRHVFLDPDPDPIDSFAERARLFALPRSSWDDYDRSLISPGGGVFPRSAKAIALSPEVRAVLGVDDETLPPAQLIRAILSAQVDLLWNGGIGTYVKATDESHADVGDRTNDALRIDASELRALVVGEGGNLGLTQRARIEYALAGGRINTDAIDNSAGVDTSDHEVNIKVLVDAQAGLEPQARVELLASMTDEIAEQVLHDNAQQNAALTVAAGQSLAMADVHRRYLAELVRSGRLDRKVEQLPTPKAFDERVRAGRGLTRPELAVLLAYTKNSLYDDVVAGSVPDDPAVGAALTAYFPPELVQRYGPVLHEHPLRREIIATAVVNRLVNAAGATYVFRTQEETGAPPDDVVRAWLVATEAFAMDPLRAAVDALPVTVPVEVRVRCSLEARRLVERVTRWLLRHERSPMDVGATIASLAEGVAVLADRLAELVPDGPGGRLREATAALVAQGVPEPVAARVAALDLLDAAPDIVTVARAAGRSVPETAAAYFAVDALLDLDWVYRRVTELPRDGRWHALARAAARDDLYAAHAALTARVLAELPDVGDRPQTASAAVTTWAADQPALGRLGGMLAEIRSSGPADLAVISVGLRELRSAVG